MKKVVLKRDPYRKSLWEWIKVVFFAVFRERSYIVPRNGSFVYYRLSPLFQSAVFLAFVALVSWTAFASRMYFLGYDIMREKDAQVEEARDRFNMLASDIRAYRDTIDAINRKMEAAHGRVVALLHKSGSLTKMEKDDLLKERLLVSTEMGYVNASLAEFAKDIKWADFGGAKSCHAAKNELEKNVVLNENVFLKKRNTRLERSIGDMSELQNNLVDKIIVLANDRIGEIEKTLSKIDIILSQVNLKDRGALVRRVGGEKDDGLGGRYVPLKNVDLDDAELNRKFRTANVKVNLWEGLDKVRTMLPLGVPVRSDIRITSLFGVRDDPFLKTPAMHTGIDFAGKDGTPLYATSKGKVVQAGNRGDYGLSVEVYHGMGFSTLYAHLSKVSVKVGDYIEEGARVGLAGSTGRSTGTHLHYELRYNGRPLNPYAFIKVENK